MVVLRPASPASGYSEPCRLCSPKIPESARPDQGLGLAEGLIDTRTSSNLRSLTHRSCYSNYHENDENQKLIPGHNVRLAGPSLATDREKQRPRTSYSEPRENQNMNEKFAENYCIARDKTVKFGVLSSGHETLFKGRSLSSYQVDLIFDTAISEGHKSKHGCVRDKAYGK